MTKLIIFDLDGVLVSTKKLHFDALNEALSIISPELAITESEHISTYDGLTTMAKLKILSEKKGLDRDKYNFIWQQKQAITFKKIGLIQEDVELDNLLSNLKKNGFKIACCSNSIKKSAYSILLRLGILDHFDLILANEDVKNPKPHPEIYWKAASYFSFMPNECLIVEDSPVGLAAAQSSGFNFLRVKDRSEINEKKIFQNMSKDKLNNTIWKDDRLNVLIPMAGAGSRFEKAGYTFPKPLIDVNGSPMIQVVVKNLNFCAKHVFIVQKAHRSKYNLDSMLGLISKDCDIIDVDGVTEGAACTTLLAKDIINNDSPLVIANSDQFVEWNTSEFMYKMQEQDVDAGILCFKSTHPKWSFVKVDELGFVTEVAEKKPISDIATVGIYYWKRGADYVKYAEQMIAKNQRHNNEFYVCPVFNEAIADGKKIKTFNIEKMFGLGTPEDLSNFLKNDNI